MLLVKAVQEQQAEVETLKAQNAELAGQLRELQKMIGLNSRYSGEKAGKK